LIETDKKNLDASLRWHDKIMNLDLIRSDIVCQMKFRFIHFISGLVGEQFALLYAVDSLRHSKNNVSLPQPISDISLFDPLNLKL
jgi:hypothetical protein